MTFLEKLLAAQSHNRSWLCLGLDPVLAKMPLPLHKEDDPLLPFNKAMIDATADLVCAYKPNLAFYLAEGAAGLIALERTLAYIPDHIPIILDGKFGDIGSTAEMIARGAFEVWGVDAVTVNPYVGEDGVAPFLQRPDKAAFVLARTSNPGAADFQTRRVFDMDELTTLADLVVQCALAWDAKYPGTCGLVVGATAPKALTRLRALAPDLPFLIPGIGAQGGDLAASVRYGPTRSGIGPIITVSRAILFASSRVDYVEAARAAARQLRDQINALREANTA
ncbi:MAG: orotidine-5'-phosphate decarboxylase [Chloroflexota bacterium]